MAFENLLFSGGPVNHLNQAVPERVEYLNLETGKGMGDSRMILEAQKQILRIAGLDEKVRCTQMHENLVPFHCVSICIPSYNN